MRQLAASAPGKAVLIGEYAVLHGTPALVMAVDRRVHVRIRACDPQHSHLQVPQLCSAAIAFAVRSGGGLDWPDARADRAELALSRRLLERALERCGLMPLPPPGGLQVLIDSSELFDVADGTAIKLGLGSSAAVSVALSLALDAYLGDGGQLLDAGAMLQLHRASQGGQGSGVDLAAALFGGVLAYRLDGGEPQARAVSWPQDWPLLFVWTGEAAATGGFLAAYESWRRAQPAAWAQLQQSLDACVRAAIGALETACLTSFMTCINQYAGLMGTIGRHIGLPVISSQHQRLAGLAAELGAAYKPCGAGGGDLGMFMAPDGEILAQLAARLPAIGCRTLQLKPSLTGVQLALSENTAGQA